MGRVHGCICTTVYVEPYTLTDVDVISKFALFEFKHGEPERGRTMFDSLLGSYPKRVDLWSVYIDCMKKQGDHDKVRCVFVVCISS